MANANAEWRHELDPLIKEHLEALVRATVDHKDVYHKAKNVSNAQLWCALAILQKQNVELSMKLKFLEKAMVELNPGKEKEKGKEEPKVDAAKALKDVLRRL